MTEYNAKAPVTTFPGERNPVPDRGLTVCSYMTFA